MFPALLGLGTTLLGGTLAAKGQKELLKKQLEGQLEVERQKTEQYKLLALGAVGVGGFVALLIVLKRRKA